MLAAWVAMMTALTPVNIDDVPGNRKAGSAEWGGVANLMWLADRKSEVAIIIFNQALPYGCEFGQVAGLTIC